jgi:hypothetical protein
MRHYGTAEDDPYILVCRAKSVRIIATGPMAIGDWSEPLRLDRGILPN